MLAPLGRDALVATSMLKEAGLSAEACLNLGMLLREIERGVGAALSREAVSSDHIDQRGADRATWSSATVRSARAFGSTA